MCLSYLGLWAWEECVAFVRQTRYTNSWLTWALTRKKVELLLWANILNSCSAALTKRREKNLFGTAEAAALESAEAGVVTQERSTCQQNRLTLEFHADWGQQKSMKMRLTRAQTSGWATQTATAGPDQKTSVPQELKLAVRDQPDCSGSVRSLCSDRSGHECPICSELLRSSVASPYSAATPPCIWRGEVGWGARPAAATSHPLVTDHLFSPHSEHQVVHSEHQHMWMLHLPSLHCQRTDTDATTLPFPAALACAAGLLLACVCTSHMMISAPFVKSNSHPAGSNVIYQPDLLFFVFCNDTFGPSPVCTAVWYSS